MSSPNFAQRSWALFPIPEAADVPGTIKVLCDGLPAARFGELSRISGVTEKHLANLAGISSSTLARRKRTGAFSPEEGERVLRLMRLAERAVALFEGDREAAAAWLQRPLDLLQGQTPLDYSRTEPGARFVLDVIDRLEAGVFS